MDSVCCAKQARFKSTVASYACTCCSCVAAGDISLLPCAVQVHRGVYVAAEILYERFKPMVKEQLASSPFAKVAFTVGHSRLSKLASITLQDKTVFTSCSDHKHLENWCISLCIHLELHYHLCTMSGVSPHGVTVLLASHIVCLLSSSTTKQHAACSAS